MHLSSAEVVIFFLSISVMLLFAKLFGELMRKLKQPAVIGEILAGIILGPTFFGYFFPDVYNNIFNESENSIIILQGITTLGVVMLMLVSGLEVDLGMVLSQGKPALLTSFFGVLFPFSTGFAVAYFFPLILGSAESNNKIIFALFIGIAVSITALPVVARTLMDLKIFKSKIGSLIISSAMFNDLVGWILFSLLLGLVGAKAAQFNFTLIIFLLFAFLFFTLFIGRKIFDYFIPIVYNKTTHPGGMLNFVLISGFLGAAFTEFIGIHAIFGAFIIGIAIGDSANLKIETKETINQFVTNIFAPLFFVSIGLRTNFILHFNPLAVISLLLIAFTGKVIGSSLGAFLGGIKKYDTLLVGFGLNSHGVMEIVLGLLALEVGLIDENLFVALVTMALVTSISSAPLMSIFIKKSMREKSFNFLLNRDLFYLTEVTNKYEILKELSEKVSAKINFSAAKIFNEIWKREETMPTGIQNYLAIPHAKIIVDEPVVAVAVSKEGIDFSAFDGIKSKIIVMLITPVGENELQLNLLAEISNKFKDKKKIETLISLENSDEIFNELKKL
jgi:Kef-type K+ transport system membrane component KefB/mannitol/fructose-specific phosphotransferase system IIA component (Ntr-type)